MRINEVLDDDEFFEPEDNYRPEHRIDSNVARKMGDAMFDFIKRGFLNFDNDEQYDWYSENPKDFKLVLRDLNRAAYAFYHNDVMGGLVALELWPQQYDVDDWALTIMREKYGIDVHKIFEQVFGDEGIWEQPAYKAAMARFSRSYLPADSMLASYNLPR